MPQNELHFFGRREKEISSSKILDNYSKGYVSAYMRLGLIFLRESFLFDKIIIFNSLIKVEGPVLS